MFVGSLPRTAMFFVSVASKGLRVYVSGLESTLADTSISVDSKGVALHQNCARGRGFFRTRLGKATALRARTGSAINEKAGAELPHSKTHKYLGSILLG